VFSRTGDEGSIRERRVWERRKRREGNDTLRQQSIKLGKRRNSVCIGAREQQESLVVQHMLAKSRRRGETEDIHSIIQVTTIQCSACTRNAYIYNTAFVQRIHYIYWWKTRIPTLVVKKIRYHIKLRKTSSNCRCCAVHAVHA
jgi:hypothetical protein